MSTSSPTTRRDLRRRGPSWRPSVLTWLIGGFVVVGAGVLLYPSAAAWLSSYNQSRLIENFSTLLEDADPDLAEQLAQARTYNSALTAGVEVQANANVPAGSGSLANDELDYNTILSADEDGLMSRVKIPGIGVDIPTYHGTSDETLLQGAGHLEGSHLPVGGTDTHSVITAHRGLANATMFTNLDQVTEGDTFTVETFGEVLSYRVRNTKVVQPEDTDSLRAESGEDLVTLITCTPLGINSHRILVTGERITPTPEEDIAAAGAASDVPGFPWWAVGMGGALLAAGVYVWRAGASDARMRAASAARTAAAAESRTE